MDPTRLSDLLSGKVSSERRLKPDDQEKLQSALCSLLPHVSHVGEEKGHFIRMHECLFPLRDLSDGYSSLLAVASHIFRHGLLAGMAGGGAPGIAGVVIIDEVELHLHPGWAAQDHARLAAGF